MTSSREYAWISSLKSRLFSNTSPILGYVISFIFSVIVCIPIMKPPSTVDPLIHTYFPLKLAFHSKRYSESLVSSMTISIPMLADLISDHFSHKSSHHRQGISTRWKLFFFFVIPDIFLYYYIAPNEFIHSFWSLLHIREIAITTAMISFLQRHSALNWSLGFSTLTIVLFNLAQTFRCFSFSNFNFSTTFGISGSICYILALALILRNLSQSLTCFLHKHGSFLVFLNSSLSSGRSSPSSSSPNQADSANSLMTLYYLLVLSGLLLSLFLFSVLSVYTPVMHDDLIPSSPSSTDSNDYALSTFSTTYLITYTYILGLFIFSISFVHSRKTNVLEHLTQQTLETKRHFVRFVSHEIRSPLNSMSAAFQLIQSYDSHPHWDASTRKDILDINREATVSCDTAVNILNDLLMYEKLEGGAMQLDLKPLPAVSLVQEVVQNFKFVALHQRVRLTVKMDDRLKHVHSSCNHLSSLTSSPYPCPCPVTISVDRAKISQVIRNLLSNAVRHSSPSQPKEELSFSSQKTHPNERSVSMGKKHPHSERSHISTQHTATTTKINHQESDSETERSESEDKFLNDVEIRLSLISINNKKRNALRLKSLNLGNKHGDFFQQYKPKVHSSTSDPESSFAGSDAGPGADHPSTTSPSTAPRTTSDPQSLSASLSPSPSQNPDLSSTSSSNSTSRPYLFRIEVKDQGPGLSPERQLSLFKEVVGFDVRDLQGEGLGGGGGGLGLFVSRGIVDLHGGNMSVYSEGEGRGSTFILELPATLNSQSVVPPSSLNLHHSHPPPSHPTGVAHYSSSLFDDDDQDFSFDSPSSSQSPSLRHSSFFLNSLLNSSFNKGDNDSLSHSLSLSNEHQTSTLPRSLTFPFNFSSSLSTKSFNPSLPNSAKEIEIDQQGGGKKENKNLMFWRERMYDDDLEANSLCKEDDNNSELFIEAFPSSSSSSSLTSLEVHSSVKGKSQSTHSQVPSFSIVYSFLSSISPAPLSSPVSEADVQGSEKNSINSASQPVPSTTLTKPSASPKFRTLDQFNSSPSFHLPLNPSAKIIPSSSSSLSPSNLDSHKPPLFDPALDPLTRDPLIYQPSSQGIGTGEKDPSYVDILFPGSGNSSNPSEHSFGRHPDCNPSPLMTATEGSSFLSFPTDGQDVNQSNDSLRSSSLSLSTRTRSHSRAIDLSSSDQSFPPPSSLHPLSPPINAQLQSSSSSPPLAKLNVLVVDDVLSNRKVLVRMLSKLPRVGSIVQAEDGQGALDLVKASLSAHNSPSQPSSLPKSSLSPPSTSFFFSFASTSSASNSKISSSPQPSSSSNASPLNSIYHQPPLMALRPRASSFNPTAPISSYSTPSSPPPYPPSADPQNQDQVDLATTPHTPYPSSSSSSISPPSFDMVFLDSVMPLLDGPSSASLMRAAGYSGPIIGVTGNVLPEDVQYFLKCGATQVMGKPVQFELLKECIETFSH